MLWNAALFIYITELHLSSYLTLTEMCDVYCARRLSKLPLTNVRGNLPGWSLTPCCSIWLQPVKKSAPPARVSGRSKAGAKRRKPASDSDEFLEDEEEYIPRPSKRRSAAAAKSKKSSSGICHCHRLLTLLIGSHMTCVVHVIYNLWTVNLTIYDSAYNGIRCFLYYSCNI